MHPGERADFEAEPHFEESLRLTRWDDPAKDPSMATRTIADFRSDLKQALPA